MKSSEKCNLSCKIPADLMHKLDEYVQISKLSKTAIVELALDCYISGNFEKMRDFQKSIGVIV